MGSRDMEGWMRERLEFQLVSFYYEVILGETRNDSRCLNAKYLSNVRNAYSDNSINCAASSISFDKPGNRCAYIFKNAPCFASAAAHHFQVFLAQNLRLLLKESVTMCCLGSGPCTEFIAIVKAFEAMLQLHHPRRRGPLRIIATVIDIEPGWSITAEIIKRILPRYVNPHVVQFELSFVEADLTQPFSEDVRRAVRNADLVTMVKFVSAIYGTENRDKIPQMLKETIRNMCQYGLLFFMNAAQFNHSEVLENIYLSGHVMNHVYGPFINTKYYMSDPALYKSFMLYLGYYGGTNCLPQCSNYVTIFCKIS